jgi:hypothetical protein
VRARGLAGLVPPEHKDALFGQLASAIPMGRLVSESLHLLSGAVLANRFAKAAMSEEMADANNHPASSTVHWT